MIKNILLQSPHNKFILIHCILRIHLNSQNIMYNIYYLLFRVHIVCCTLGGRQAISEQDLTCSSLVMEEEEEKEQSSKTEQPSNTPWLKSTLYGTHKL